MISAEGAAAGDNQEPSAFRSGILSCRVPACWGAPLSCHPQGARRPESWGKSQGPGGTIIRTPFLAGHRRGTGSGK